jgi:hypothetical protein
VRRRSRCDTHAPSRLDTAHSLAYVGGANYCELINVQTRFRSSTPAAHEASVNAAQAGLWLAACPPLSGRRQGASKRKEGAPTSPCWPVEIGSLLSNPHPPNCDASGAVPTRWFEVNLATLTQASFLPGPAQRGHSLPVFRRAFLKKAATRAPPTGLGCSEAAAWWYWVGQQHLLHADQNGSSVRPYLSSGLPLSRGCCSFGRTIQ